jgi:hypothetical protein
MDRRIEKTKVAIQQAFIELITSESQGKVTITEIASKANICRKTFYLHYQSTDDIVRDLQSSFEKSIYLRCQKYLHEQGQTSLSGVFKDLNELIVPFLPMLCKVAKSSYHIDLIKLCKGAISPSVELVLTDYYHIDSKYMYYYTEYFSSGIADLYVKWMSQDNVLSIEEMTQIAVNVCFTGMDQLRKKDESNS